MVSMNKLPYDKRAQVIACICEGNSIRPTVRLTGVAKTTVTKLLIEVGHAAAEYENRVLRNLKCKRIQCDEIWSFVYAKQKNVTPDIATKRMAGDVWTWLALDADSKLIVSWMIGDRTLGTAKHFIDDLKGRLADRVQLTTDGHKAYLEAVEGAFGSEIDYAMLSKIYASSQEETRYSPAECIGCEVKRIAGSPNPKHISTNYSERLNLSMRMQIRRFTRLTNAFSKKAENHAAAVAVFCLYYNFVRVHRTLRVTPAVEAGVTGHLWTVGEMLKNILN
jgi:IS1 family transposase